LDDASFIGTSAVTRTAKSDCLHRKMSIK
jgi:hypothetical protein